MTSLSFVLEINFVLESKKKNVGNLTDSLSHKTNKEDALTVLCSVVEHLGSG